MEFLDGRHDPPSSLRKQCLPSFDCQYPSIPARLITFLSSCSGPTNLLPMPILQYVKRIHGECASLYLQISILTARSSAGREKNTPDVAGGLNSSFTRLGPRWPTC